MRFFEVRERFTATAIMTKPLVPWLTAFLLTACPSKTDPPQETAQSASAPVTIAPSASVSSVPVPAAPSASATASAAAPAPIPAGIDPETVTAVVVWKEDKQARGRYRSVWVEREGDKPKTIGERPGILFMSSTSLWTLETTIVKGCPQNPQLVKIKPDGDEYRLTHSTPDMDMPELTRISDGKRVAPWKDGHGYPYTGTQCDPAIEEYSANVNFEGGMGPFVVARMGTYLFAGGAHGLRGDEFFTINLEIADAVKLAPRPEDQPALIKSAAKGLGAEPKDVDSNGSFLLYGPNGAGLAIYRYFAPGTYAGSGGNSYSSDFEISSKNLPPEVTGYGKLPTWVLPLLKPKSIPIFMVPAAQKDLFKSQFDAAYPKTK